MEFKDYYKILNVEPDAGNKTIKISYRKLARKHHPDISDQHNAEAQFREVTEAYEVLKNSDKCAEYDKIRQYDSQQQEFCPPHDWQSSGSARVHQGEHNQGEFSDFFSSVFGDTTDVETHGFSGK